jgi:hypothetical protein
VQQWFSKIAWVLVLHSQTRVVSINAGALFIPIGKPVFGVALTAITFYAVAVPVAGTMALTDLVTTNVSYKMAFCVGCTSAAQLLQAVIGFAFLGRMDWVKMGEVIEERANTDKEEGEGSGEEKGGRGKGQGGSSRGSGDDDAVSLLVAPPPPRIHLQRSGSDPLSSPPLGSSPAFTRA